MDLFGEDDSDDEPQRQESPPRQNGGASDENPSPSSPKSPKRKAADSDEDEDNRGLFGSDDESEGDKRSRDEQDDEMEEDDEGDRFDVDRPEQFAKVENPRLNVPNVDLPVDQQLYAARLPDYIQVEPIPFNESDFKENLEDQEEEEDEAQLRVKLESTIRWRYGKSADGKTNKETNSRLIKWSDGSFSLLLGEEMFDVVLSKQEQEYQYLVATHQEEIVFQTQARFQEHMTFRPSGLNSRIHQKLTATIAAKHKKEAKTRLTDVQIDPDKVKEEAEKNELELRKAHRKIQQTRRSYNRSLRTGDLDDDSDDDNMYASGNRNMVGKLSKDTVDDEDDDDDSFIEDDEDGDEYDRRERERDERVLKVKRGLDADSGRKSVSKMAQELDESSESDEGLTIRKKRAAQLSDSDDD